MSKVNLDAIIPREDFDFINENSENQNTTTISNVVGIRDIQNPFFITTLRKPDFQRETNEWDPEKIVEFIQSFLDGDLIPAAILWKASNGYIFVIDGSHRLSALIAWVKDDYGDNQISKKFYDHKIAEEQVDIALKTRELVRKKIGSFADFELSLTNPDKVDDKIKARAKNLWTMSIQLQWVPGNVQKAESSFFKINQKASPINTTELKLLEARKKPNCIAARAIIKSGKGHKYWSSFSEENQIKIQTLAKEINEILFEPKFETPLKTLDLPIGGPIYRAQTLPLVFEFVNIANNAPDNFRSVIQDDASGNETIEYLTRARKIAWRMNNQHPSSLGLHPIVYFYSQDGRHKPASFYAVIAFLKELDKINAFTSFVEVRKDFENILLKNEHLVQQITRDVRNARGGGYLKIADFYTSIFQFLKNKIPQENVIEEIVKQKQFNSLKLLSNQNEISSNDFSKNRKSAVYIREVLDKAPRCKICNGYIHKNSITIDHIIRKEDGGLGSIDNGQIAHPYCNSTVKN